MRAFEYAAARTPADAFARTTPRTAYLAGGTTLVDLMKLGVVEPDAVIDINGLGLRGIRLDRDGLRVGALERMSDVAEHPVVAAEFPVVAQALQASASPQIRNMASIGGNLLQRTRCGYFRDVATACNKRQPGSGCPAQTGANRGHAVFGTSASCVATHASDLAVALVALDARVELAGPAGRREVPLADFYRLPGDSPQVENDLRPGELVTAVAVPRLAFARRSTYLKVRDRQSYEFALVSVAAALDVRNGTVRDVRLAVGGVGTRPWRLPLAEQALRGKRLTEATARQAVEAGTADARPLAFNAFKPALLRRTAVRTLLALGG
ncbi:FAD binding domain-containing protein [Yinghuangia seranimata]|uniref:FAD binding domain-containing protein n=1 Tax=Yinghuangia seranimata TaxID=408067 RepID=UPI00248B942F|nr:xanthine dehydrogenase family protein subunit M [Yinghuangia seranimata]MDI2127669.1 xanthine dehydrogenase family protein subunit M [Yinghuangia seranimata]